MNAIDLLAVKAKDTSATGHFDPQSTEPVQIDLVDAVNEATADTEAAVETVTPAPTHGAPSHAASRPSASRRTHGCMTSTMNSSWYLPATIS